MKLHASMPDNLTVNVLETTAPELAAIDLTESVWTDHLLGVELGAEFLQKRVAGGQSKAVTLEVNGVKSYVLIFTVNDANFLCVQNIVTLKPTLNFRAIIDWIINELAPALNVRAVIADTKSAAVYRLAKSVGFESVGVILFKKI